ncbi:CRP/FNR family transcriptional regulator [Breoghania corrubedonensis]|uniref:CRP/FNR family transcriptional regulator n=1 Tax=Breoghania corrubedonensis TaxID=665038 RepID=A0A2T5VEC8_9HYPH|nr:helix-turn-helix domain-containing protein [Breoghania corrubedonensis]PTW62093.1 CRP/FNR family transcriptional regulator [Breoghania corrubedonensis]
MTYVEHSSDALDLAAAGAGLTDVEAVWADYVNSPKIRKLSLSPHEAIFYEGDPADHIYELAGGSVMLYKLLPDGRRQVVEILKEGDLFGFQRGRNYDCTAETLSGVELRALNRRDIDVSLSLQRYIGERMFAKMESLHEHAMLLGRKSAMERVASYLMRFVPGRGTADCTGPAEDIEVDDGMIELSMTRQEIADFLGLTIETVSRAISELKRRGLIRIEKQDRILIPRICNLCRLTGMH